MSGTSHTLSADWTNLVNMLLYFTEQSSPVAPITKKIEHICHNTSDSLSLSPSVPISSSFSQNFTILTPKRPQIPTAYCHAPDMLSLSLLIFASSHHHVPHLTPTTSTDSYCHAPLSLLIFASSWWNFSITCHTLPQQNPPHNPTVMPLTCFLFLS